MNSRPTDEQRKNDIGSTAPLAKEFYHAIVADYHYHSGELPAPLEVCGYLWAMARQIHPLIDHNPTLSSLYDNLTGECQSLDKWGHSQTILEKYPKE